MGRTLTSNWFVISFIKFYKGLKLKEFLTYSQTFLSTDNWVPEGNKHQRIGVYFCTDNQQSFSYIEKIIENISPIQSPKLSHTGQMNDLFFD